jgi:hypothetical protein
VYEMHFIILKKKIDKKRIIQTKKIKDTIYWLIQKDQFRHLRRKEKRFSRRMEGKNNGAARLGNTG